MRIGLAGVLLILSCRSGAVTSTERPGEGEASIATSPAEAHSTGRLPDAAAPTGAASGPILVPAREGLEEPTALPVPPSHPYIVDARFPDCSHPGVKQQCDAGWCRIPPGCFIWGSPEWEPKRAESREQQGPVTLTRAFEMQQHEVTMGEWTALGFEVPFGALALECGEADCAIDRVSWFHAAAFANALSLAHDPPLEPCYRLASCEMSFGSYVCGGLHMTAATAYECEGYRLPTRAEWQYAARAGTTTTYYSGDITITEQDEQLGCPEDPNLNPIAWYCFNSGRKTHPVGGRLPNAWGLYDMLGNVAELHHDEDLARSPEYPATNPFGEIGIPESARPECGGSVVVWPSLLRIASGLSAQSSISVPGVGFRLARTLLE